jgi:hypothetical protein
MILKELEIKIRYIKVYILIFNIPAQTVKNTGYVGVSMFPGHFSIYIVI